MSKTNSLPTILIYLLTSVLSLLCSKAADTTQQVLDDPRPANWTTTSNLDLDTLTIECDTSGSFRLYYESVNKPGKEFKKIVYCEFEGQVLELDTDFEVNRIWIQGLSSSAPIFNVKSKSFSQNSMTKKYKLWVRQNSKDKSILHKWYTAQLGDRCECPMCKSEKICYGHWFQKLFNKCPNERIKYTCSDHFCNYGKKCELQVRLFIAGDNSGN